MNHYEFIEKFSAPFTALVQLRYPIKDLSIAHGDKCYGYRAKWEEQGIDFKHGAMIYLLSYCYPYSTECRGTDNGWVPVDEWVVGFYNRPEIKAFFESCSETNRD